MAFLMILLVVAAVLSILTIRVVAHDGRGSQQPPSSHFQDPQFRSPASA